MDRGGDRSQWEFIISSSACNKYQQSCCFYPLLRVIFGLSTFCCSSNMPTMSVDVLGRSKLKFLGEFYNSNQRLQQISPLSFPSWLFTSLGRICLTSMRSHFIFSLPADSFHPSFNSKKNVYFNQFFMMHFEKSAWEKSVLFLAVSSKS